ncbi:hypothetical protein HNP46_001005 [Pseudomonas nitritireducens]|uniref:Uncharacterized protein n=1 Tax=Pseudomonas nitroreducens TaxID=46680 RepID=A0A7W7KG24_PSENT|nr:hypothetical protein [Pseudomonas nitritireducens]MBB4862167.1 hypothetical protein [Pseudomonas nitritireducens]
MSRLSSACPGKPGSAKSPRRQPGTPATPPREVTIVVPLGVEHGQRSA